MVEGMLSGCNFMLIYMVITQLWTKTMDLNKILQLTGILAAVFVIRLIIYSTGYTLGQIGGASISKKIRLALGDKIKRIPMSRFTKNQTGEYINVLTSDVNNYEKILTHRIGDIVKNLTLAGMVGVFASTIYIPSGMMFFVVLFLLIPSLYFSFRHVKKYGNNKNRILADNVSDVTEYITGMQTFRAYGIGGTKNKKVTESMREYSDISYVYEKKIIPIGILYSILQWLCVPAVVLITGKAWVDGIITAPEFITVSIMPLFSCKLNSSLFIDFTAFKNLTISKRHICGMMDEKEEPVTKNNFDPGNYSVEFKNVEFSYVPEEPVFKNLNFKVENQKLTAIIGDSGSGKSTILNMISKYYAPQSGSIKIGGMSIEKINSEKVLEKISMVDQDVFLFDDSIRNNIRYARQNATDEEIEKACKLANWRYNQNVWKEKVEKRKIKGVSYN